MILAFSTSSPLASVALFRDDWSLVDAGEEVAPQGASSACLRILQSLLRGQDVALQQVTLFAADIGPGSFTGVRVGVTLAKTLALTVDAKCAGATSFDLIDPAAVVVLPSKKGEWFIRDAGHVSKASEIPGSPFVGYGPGLADPVYPHAKRFAGLNPELVAPEALLPAYLTEPSISKPNKPFGLTR